MRVKHLKHELFFTDDEFAAGVKISTGGRPLGSPPPLAPALNELIAKFDTFFKKAVRWGYSCELNHLSGLLHEAGMHTTVL